MDNTERKITKIAREANRVYGADDERRRHRHSGNGCGFTLYGATIYNTKRNVGSTEDRQGRNGASRGAAGVKKGYPTREPNPLDGRSQLLYPTEKSRSAPQLQGGNCGSFYEWLLDGLPDDEKEVFCKKH